MCGRISCYLSRDDLSCACKFKNASGEETKVTWLPDASEKFQYSPSYNIAPTDTVACIVAGSHFNVPSERIFCSMKWGLIPRWHQGNPKQVKAVTHNGRSETLGTMTMYCQPFDQGKRCVIVVNGFYEWQTKLQGSKQPYYMYKKNGDDDGPTTLKLAGLFDRWKSPEGEVIYSCLVITTAANEVLSWLHSRAPIILETEQQIQDWLNYKEISSDKALSAMRQHNLSADFLQWHAVSSTINKSINNDKSCIEPFTVRKPVQNASSRMMSAWLKKVPDKCEKRKSDDSEGLEPIKKIPKID